MKTNRSNFSGKIGFILAAAGSAVGLGNIWRFPYLAAKYGGGSFLICYIILAVTFGFTLMVAEIAIGRKTGLSAIGAFQNWINDLAFRHPCRNRSNHHPSLLFSNRRMGFKILLCFYHRRCCHCIR